MNRLFNPDNPVMIFLARLFDIMILNLLFIFCSIPIFTIGAALSAFYSVTLKMVKDEETYITKDFFKAFKTNFGQSVILTAIVIGIFTLLYFDWKIINSGQFAHQMAIHVLFMAISIIIFCMILYVFPLHARFVNSVWQTLKNALLMSIGHLPYTLLLLGIHGLLLFLITRSVYIFATCLFISCFGGIGLVIYLKSFIFRKIFNRYEPKPEPIVDPFEEALKEIEEETKDSSHK